MNGIKIRKLVLLVVAFVFLVAAGKTSAATSLDPKTAGVPAGTNLVRQDGNVVLGAGQTLEGKDLHGCVQVNGDGASIRNSKISDCSDGAGNIRVNASNVTIENVESFKNGATGFVVFVGYCLSSCNGVGNVHYINNVTIRHSKFYGGGDNMIVTGVNGFTLEGSNLHDPVAANGSHTDALQFTASNHVVIRNNILNVGVGGANGGTYVGGAFIKADFDVMDDILVEHNDASGGTAALQCYGSSPANDYNGTPYGPPTNCIIRNNIIQNVAYTNPKGAQILQNTANGNTTSCNTFPDKTTPVKITTGDSPRAVVRTDTVDSTCKPGPQPDGAISQPPVSGTPTQTCSTKSQGDANCDGLIKIGDYVQWRNEFLKTVTTKTADFNGDGQIRVNDYVIWRNTFVNDFLPPASVSNTPPPSSGGRPDAINTGPLTPPTKTWPQSAGAGGQITVTGSADGFIFNGCVKTGSAGVRITNSEIRGDCSVSILTDSAGGGVFERNNIIDVGNSAASTIGCGFNSRFFRNNAKGGADGVKESTNCQVIENYIHDLAEYVVTGGGTHNDGVQIEGGGTTGMKINGNTFENTCGKSGIQGQGCAGAIFINNGASGNTVDGNYIKKWNGPTAGFIFHTSNAGVNTISNNVIECANISGFGETSGGPSIYTNNTNCP